MSRTITFAKAGGPEVLDYVEAEAPNPGANEVRIKVKAIGLNRAESMWRLDDYIEPLRDFLPCSATKPPASLTHLVTVCSASPSVTRSM
jgi:NADPH:quinone reductase-like Zn-dependent oxidoreductase